MTNQVIPEAAVEAAAVAHYELCGGHWEDTLPEYQAEALDDMRAALEAAAPHIEGAAHNRGWRARYQSCVNKGCR